jgi:hypothetical protein
MRTYLICFAACAAASWAGAADKLFELQSTSLRVGPYPISIATGDLNEDGIPEILTADRGRLADPREPRPAEANLSFLVGGPDFSFTPQPQMRTGFGPYRIRIVNIDALRAPDILTVNFMATRDRDLTLLRNLGENLFEPIHFSVPDDALPYTKQRDADDVPLYPKPGLTSFDVADLNADGYRDVVATAWSSDALVTFPGDPVRYFGEPVITPLSGGPRDIYLTKLDDDAIPDAVVTLYSDQEIAVLTGQEDGHFELVDRFPSRGALPVRVSVADLNGDGRKDIVVAHRHADDSVVVFFGDDFAFSQEIRLGEIRGKVEKGIQDMICADLDGDGLRDIAVSCAESQEVIVLRNRTSKGAAKLAWETEHYSFEKGRPHAMSLSDFNGDEHPDIAVTLWESDSVQFLFSR